MNNLTKKTRKYEDYCSYCKNIYNRERLITAAAVIGIGRCCLVKHFKNCPNHGEGELVIKKRWIGVKNCSGCVNEYYPPDENGINQIVWSLDMEGSTKRTQENEQKKQFQKTN